MDDENELITATKPVSKPLRCRTHGKFAQWFSEINGSLAITAYTSGKLVLLTSSEGRVRYRTKHFPRPMGLAFDGNRFALAVKQRILQFQCCPAKASSCNDTRFVPEQEFHTGRLDIHEMAFGQRGLYFANTRFNCISRASIDHKFICCWRPPFIPEMIPQDRCHLNGIGLVDGRPAMATAFCATDQQGDWRKLDRFSSGVLLDVKNKKVLTDRLCMPHSPRWYQGRWWLCNSGYGTLEVFDPVSGSCREFCALPGLTRGLCFVKDHALVGLSRVRREHLLDAPPVRERHAKLISGLALVNLNTRQHVGTLEFIQGGREVFDLIFMPEILRPAFAAKNKKPN